MVDLAFVKQHNMVDYLEKTEENADFHQILDFLTSSLINFALTISPTIYASYIEQFWNTACLKTINSEKQIHANVDGKAVVVSESSVRRDLHLNDEDGTACLTTNEIFENLALMGYEPASDKLTFYKGLFSPQWKYLIHTILHCLSSKSTSWDQFSTNLASAIICLAKGQKFNFSKLIFDVPPVVVGEGSEQPPEPQPIPSTASPEVLSQVTTVVGDEAINKEMLDSVERGATTVSSLEAKQASGSGPWHQETMGGMQDQTSMEHQIELTDNVPNIPPDSPLPGVNTPRSDDGSLKLNELMDLVTKLSHRVLDLEKVKTVQAKEIAGLKRRVTKLEQRQRSRILKNHPFRFSSSRRQSLGKKDVSKQGRKHLKTQLQFREDAFDDIDDLVDQGMDFVQEKDTAVLDTEKAANTAVFDDEDVTMAMAQTLIRMKEEKAKEKGVVIKGVEDSSRPVRSITTLQPLPTIDPKEKGDAQIEKDVEVGLRLQAELDEELRAMMDADYELAARMTEEEQEKYTIKERARLLAEFFERRKKQLAAERAEAIRNKPPTKTQLRNLMMTYLKNMGGYKHSQLKGKSYEEIQGLYERQQKRIQDFTPMDSEKEAQKLGKRLKRVAGSYAQHKSPKKPKVMKSTKDVTEEEAAEYEKEKEELRLSLKIISNDDSEVDYEPLSRKFPIVNWEYQLLGKMEVKDMYVYKLTRADGSSSYHGDTQAFLRRLDRQDLNDLYRVHTLFMDSTPMEINMLVEKKYPLIKELLEKMLNLQLEAEEESTMAFELIKFNKSLLKE
ncbi:hypothetical protein Tco_0996254 [Tanacetum coccineum]